MPLYYIKRCSQNTTKADWIVIRSTNILSKTWPNIGQIHMNKILYYCIYWAYDCLICFSSAVIWSLYFVISSPWCLNDTAEHCIMVCVMTYLAVFRVILRESCIMFLTQLWMEPNLMYLTTDDILQTDEHSWMVGCAGSGDTNTLKCHKMWEQYSQCE